MPNVFFYTIGIAFTGGIFFRSFFDIGLEEILLVLLISFAFSIIWIREEGQNKKFLTPLFIISLSLLFVSLGALRLDIVDKKISSLNDLVGNEVELNGVVIREPDVREKNVHLYTKVEEADEIVLVTSDRYQEVSYGDEIIVVGELKLPEAFETDLGRTFNYPGYLKARGVTHMISFAEVEVVGAGEGNALIAFLLIGKGKFTNVIEKTIPEPQVGLGEGLLLGMKRALGEDLEDAFRKTGIIHIVVLSGYNVMIVAEAIMRLLSFFFRPRIRIVIGVAAIASFALLVGLTATVVRASIMAVFVLLARATGRVYAILRGLMIAGIIMLLFNPYLLAFDPGFQLSFLATLGLILLAPIIERRLKLVPTRFQIREFLTATVSTQIFVTPLLLYLMGSVSVVAVIVNVLVLPAVPFAMLFTFITGVVALISTWFASVVGLVAHVLLTYIVVVAEMFAKFPYITIDVGAFPFALVLIAYVLLGVFIYRISNIKIKKTSDKSKDDEYDLSDWTIEEEIEVSPEGQRPSGDSLPFR